MFTNSINSNAMFNGNVQDRASDDFSAGEELQPHEVEPCDRYIKCHGYGTHQAKGRWVNVPTILVRGKWLKKYGFSIDSKVHIHAELGEITIRIAKS